MSTKAEIEISASSARLPAALRAATKLVLGFASAAGRALGGIRPTGPGAANPLGGSRGPGGGWGQHAFGQVVGNMATRGLDVLIDQGKQVFEFNKQLVRFGLASRIAGKDLDAVGAGVREVAAETGIGSLEVLRGARAYVDLAGAENYSAQKMSLIARAAQASGSDIGDMATVVFSLTNALKISGPELEDTIGGMINQSKSGAIHFSQMAQEIVSLAPVYAQFGVTGRDGANKLSAALQIVRTGFGSASEAGTGLLRLMRSLPQHAALFEKSGVQIFKKGSRTDLLDLDTIMNNIYKSKLRLDRPALIKAFGRGEAERSYQMFLGDSIEKYHELIEQGKMNGVVVHDGGVIAESAAGRVSIAMEKMKNAVAAAFTPERIDKFVDAIEGLVDKVEPIANAIGKIGDVLGAVYGAGRAIRGAVSSNANDNPYYDIAHDQNRMAIRARAHGVKYFDETQMVNESRVAYDKATEDLVGSMKGDTATADSKRMAVRDKYTPTSDTGGEGMQEAGIRFLEKIKLSKEEEAKILAEISGQQKSVADAAGLVTMTKADLTSAIVEAMTSSSRVPDTVLKLDGNPVAKSVSNAPDKRRR